MHVMIIAPGQLPLPGSGSVEISIWNIARQLAQQHQVTVISRLFSKHRSVREERGKIRMIRVPVSNSRAYIQSVLKTIQGKKVDVIQVDNRPLYIHRVKQAFPRTPVSLFLHSLTFVPKTKSVQTNLQLADLIIANSESLKQSLIRRFPSQQHKIKKVYLGVESNRFKPKSSLRRLNRASRPFTILFAGRIIPRKGLPILIEATGLVRKKFKHVRLVVAGKGNSSYIQKLKTQARSLHVPVSFIGEVPHHRIHQVYQTADCFVCPSQLHESFGLVNIEAMASGLPVVASRIGGIKEIIRHGINGYLVGNYSNPQAFAKYLLQLAANRNHAVKLGSAGRIAVLQQFNWRRTAQNLSEIYTGYKGNRYELSHNYSL